MTKIISIRIVREITATTQALAVFEGLVAWPFFVVPTLDQSFVPSGKRFGFHIKTAMAPSEAFLPGGGTYFFSCAVESVELGTLPHLVGWLSVFFGCGQTFERSA